MRRVLLALLALAFFTGCERYQVIAQTGGEDGLVYMKDTSTGKIYAVHGAWIREVPLP